MYVERERANYIVHIYIYVEKDRERERNIKDLLPSRTIGIPTSTPPTTDNLPALRLRPLPNIWQGKGTASDVRTQRTSGSYCWFITHGL
jgi:hypothetical protein